MSSLKFYEIIKTILSDVDSFLSISLKSVKLSKTLVAEKDEILKKMEALMEEYPQLRSEKKPKLSEVSKSADSLASNEPIELYDAIGEKGGTGAGGTGAGGNGFGASGEYNSSQKSSNSDVSADQPGFVSASELLGSATFSGNLLRKNFSKGKVDIKSMLMSIFGGKYVVVSSGVFYIFDKASSKKQNSCFPLKGYEVRAPVEQPSKKEFVFELVCPGQKSYMFATTTEAELEKWMDALKTEALKTPDPHSSIFYDTSSIAEDAGEDYEDTGDFLPPPSKNTKKSKEDGAPVMPKPLPPRAMPLPPVGNDDDELYDDIADAKKTTDTTSPEVGEEEELYDEAESKFDKNGYEDDILYEAYDDIKAAACEAPPRVVPPKVVPPKVVPPKVVPPKVVPINEPKSNAVVVSGSDAQYDKMYYGKWDCRSDAGNELEFSRGDIILVLSQEYEKFGWWVGEINGKIGLVPREYLSPAYELVSG